MEITAKRVNKLVFFESEFPDGGLCAEASGN